MGADARQTFLFADLAGFTALTEAHGDEHAADLAERFCDAVCELLLGYHPPIELRSRGRRRLKNIRGIRCA